MCPVTSSSLGIVRFFLASLDFALQVVPWRLLVAAPGLCCCTFRTDHFVLMSGLVASNLLSLPASFVSSVG